MKLLELAFPQICCEKLSLKFTNISNSCARKKSTKHALCFKHTIYDDINDRRLMSENVDTVDAEDAVSSSTSKWPRLSSVEQLDDDVKTFTDSTSDTLMSLSTLSADDAICMHRTVTSSLPNAEARFVAGMF